MLVAGLSIVGIVSVRTNRGLILQMLERRVVVLAKAVTATMPRIETLQEAKKADADVAYLHFAGRNGLVMESTVDGFKGQEALWTEFEKEMAAASRLVRRPVPGVSGLFEVAAPVILAGTQMDAVIQQNAGQTQELSSTTQNLTAQAEELSAPVAQFTLAGMADIPQPAAVSGAPTAKVVSLKGKQKGRVPRPISAKSGTGDACGTFEEFSARSS